MNDRVILRVWQIEVLNNEGTEEKKKFFVRDCLNKMGPCKNAEKPSLEID